MGRQVGEKPRSDRLLIFRSSIGPSFGSERIAADPVVIRSYTTSWWLTFRQKFTIIP